MYQGPKARIAKANRSREGGAGCSWPARLRQDHGEFPVLLLVRHLCLLPWEMTRDS